MNTKIKCRDCGELTHNKTERCGYCRKIWRDNMNCMCNGFKGNAKDMAAIKAKCMCDNCRGSRMIGPGACTNITKLKIEDFMQEINTIECSKCNNKYGMFPQTAIISSSMDCPYCAESQPHIKHVNGFKLLNTIEEIDMGFIKCDKCGEQIHTSHLPLTTCNTCLSKEDDKDIINWPKHYNTGKIQPIDVIEDWELDFRLANTVKYIQRHKHKGNAKKDLEKAIWYIQRYIDKEITKEGK